MAVRLEIAQKAHLFDPAGAGLTRRAEGALGICIESARVIQVLTLDTRCEHHELEALRRDIFTNPVTQESSFSPLAREFSWAVWVGYRPGVRDTAGSVALDAIAGYLGREAAPDEAVYTSRLSLLSGPSLTRRDAEAVARELLANEIVQQWRVFSREEWDEDAGIGVIVPRVILSHTPAVAELHIPSDDALARLSRERGLALNPRDIPVIREYFLRPEVVSARAKVGLSSPTDVELEAISQARSDHCNHNTFGGRFRYRDLETGEEETIDSLFATFIKAPTLAVKARKDWVVSVLWDNAGVARFDDENYYCVKAETHNSPSTMEAYGGAITGIVGVYRDVMGTGRGARLVGGLYGYCVAPRDYAGPLAPRLHPRRLLDGVIEGVKDGGNKHGVPTQFGCLLFDESYLGKCLLFAGALGIMPKTAAGEPTEEKTARPGDLIIMCGGRVGKDGIHGVTASSETYSEHTPAGHVQIGDPYTQKKMADFLLDARDEGLVRFVTDNGGGGLSSSVGESGRMAGGCRVELDRVPLKYEGLDVWEIWVSESQERMTIAVAPGHLDRFMALSRLHEVESSVIGRYEATGKIHLLYGGKTCACLDVSFLEEDFPQWEFEAQWRAPEARGLHEPVLEEPDEYGKLLRAMLARPNIASHEWIQRQYDHEVQGGSAVKMLVGRDRDVPGDAAVFRPVLSSRRGLAVTQALIPQYSRIDAGAMAAASVDEAVRRLLSVGALFGEIGGVDNFCWPTIQHDPVANPDGREKAAALVRACRALRDLSLSYGVPLLSGKDSMYVDGSLPGSFGERHKVSGLPAMMFTATGVVPDIERALTMEAKMPGDAVYVLGVTANECGASEYYELLGHVGVNVPRVDAAEFRPLYEALSRAVAEGIPASCHAIARGGLGVHAALVAFAGQLGMTLDLAKLPRAWDLRDDQALFSESCGRFLVTVPRGREGEFEAHFRGLPCARVGEVTEDPRLIVTGGDGRVLMEDLVTDLRESWLGPFGGLS